MALTPERPGTASTVRKSEWLPILQEEVIYARNFLGITYLELARRSGVAQPQITNFMSGKRGLSAEAAEKLFRALGFELKRPKHSPGRRPSPDVYRGREPTVKEIR